MLFQLHVDMLIISRWKLIGSFGRKKKSFFFLKKKSLDRLVVVVAAVRTVKFARYMEERAEAKAPARWKTLQLLIQPSTCSLSCVCLNVNSDCVRPRVKRIAAPPHPPVSALICSIPFTHSVTVLHRQRVRQWSVTVIKSRLTFAGDTCGSFFSFFERAPVTSAVI